MPQEKKLTFRNLNADEIEVRVGTTTKDKNGNVTHFSFLLYKNARVDMAILDETFGFANWQARYYQVKNTMICSVGVNVNYNDPSLPPVWVWKDNGGDDDFTTEQVKAECSDSFKRACFLLGVGRGLYSASKLYMRIERTEENTEKGYYGCKEIEYDSNGNITKVVIYNKKTNKEVLTATLKGNKSAPKPKVEDEPKGFTKEDEQLINKFQGFDITEGSISEADKLYLTAYFNTADDSAKEKFQNYIAKNYHTTLISKLSELQGNELVNMFKNKGK